MHTMHVPDFEFTEIKLIAELLELRKLSAAAARLGFKAREHARADATGMAHAVIDRFLAKQRVQRNVALRVPGFHVLPMIIANSDLLAVIPSRLAQAFVLHVPIKVLPLPISIPPFDIRIYCTSDMTTIRPFVGFVPPSSNCSAPDRSSIVDVGFGCRNISKKLCTMESNRAARTMFDTLSENCIFYISQLYEFSHRLGQPQPLE